MSFVHDHLLNDVLVVNARSHFVDLLTHFGDRSIVCDGRINDFLYILAVRSFILSASNDLFWYGDFFWFPDPSRVYFLRH